MSLLGHLSSAWTRARRASHDRQ